MRRRSPAATVLMALAAALALALAQAPAPRAVALRASVSAQQLAMDRGAAAVWQSLQKLHTRASLLMVVAHPDDEDSGLLAYASRGQGARVALLTLNRGEGGQNLKSDDFDDALGLIRTQELLAADRYYGVQQYFTPAIDFGFSKTEAETMQKWGHESMLADAVRVVRMTRPLVVASVFVGGPSDGHGNHAAAGELAQEVYNAAGDPNMFPDQIRAGLAPWKPLKVYARVPVNAFTPRGIYDSASQVYTPGRIYDYVHQTWIEGQPSITVEIPENGQNSVLGLSYSQIGAEGRQWHETQFASFGRGGPGRGRGGNGVPYHLYASRVATTAHETTMFDGIDTTLMGIADLADTTGPEVDQLRANLTAINAQVESAMETFSAAAPDQAAPFLAQGLADTNVLIAQVRASHFTPEARSNILHELTVKQAQFNDALVEALGLSLTASAEAAAAVPGQTFAVNAQLSNATGPVQFDAITLGSPTAPGTPAGYGAAWTVAAVSAPAAAALAPNQSEHARFEVTVPANAHLTRPYFSRTGTEQPYYDIDDARYRTLPQMPYPLAAWAHLHYHGVAIEFGQVVQTAAAEPLAVVPAVSVAIAPRIGIMPLPAAPFPLTVTVANNVPQGAAGTARLRLPAGWSATPASARFTLGAAGASAALTFQIVPRGVTAASGPYTITAVASFNGRDYEQGYRSVGYTDLRPSNYYTPASYLTRGVDVRLASGLKAGYIPGTGDGIPATLANLGVRVDVLNPTGLTAAALAAHNVIVLGIRTYDADPALRTENPLLLDYVHNGGVLIVQYQSAGFDPGYGPYPYTLGGEGATVVDEDSAVDILAPDNPVLSWPNKIGAADFLGWNEERGHGFMASWDPRYIPLLSMHDAQQPPQRGGLLYAPYGQGVYVYEGLALYRQLAAGVPGGYRLFANLLSLPKRPISK